MGRECGEGRWWGKEEESDGREEEGGIRKREKEGKGGGEKREGRQGKASGGKNSRSLARLSWPRMQPRLALFGQSGLVTAKPHSSLPLAVADPNFCTRCSSPACTQSARAASQILSPPHSLSGSHMSDLSDVSSPNALYRIHPTTLISILAFFFVTFSHRYARSSFMRPVVWVPAFLFCSLM